MALQHSPHAQVQQHARWDTRLRRRKPLIGLVISAMLLLTPMLVLFNVSAASSFASPLFQTQWQQGEAIVPNFWGPLPLAKDGQNEPYVEAPGGQRLVQYFDKARMELTNPATNTVTNGLLATELITGNRQLGDNTFQTIGPANIPVAGDPSNIGPTYAMIQMNAAQLRVPVTSTPGSPVTAGLSSSGTFTPFPSGASFPLANIAGYDSTTQHNVPGAFLNFRNTAGLLTIGLAIAEPFWSNVKVAGNDTQVLIQAFERRVLTYTPSNPAAFQVEMGNIGQHYYTWRYVTNPDSGSGTATGTSTSTVTSTATSTATTTTTPPTLTNPTLSNVTATKVTVAFTASAPVCGTAELRVKGDTSWTTNINSISCTPDTKVTVTLTGLNPNTQYEVRGAAKDASNNIAYSSIASFTTLSATPTADSYEANWVNDDSTSGISELIIDATGNTLKIHAYFRATPKDIDWGTQTVTFAGDPVTVTFDHGGGVTDKLTIGFTDDTRLHLKVVDVSTVGGTHTYTFHRKLVIISPIKFPVGP